MIVATHEKIFDLGVDHRDGVVLEETYVGFG